MSTKDFAHVKLVPDWDELCVQGKIEQQLKIKFKGAGWYENATDTLLIMDAGKTTGTKFAQAYGNRKLYRVCVWNAKLKTDIIRNVKELGEWLEKAETFTNYYL